MPLSQTSPAASMSTTAVPPACCTDTRTSPSSTCRLSRAAIQSRRPRIGGAEVEETVKYLLPESEIPTHWVNLLPDLPGDPVPPLNPQTQQPAGPDDLTPIFPMALIQQEVSPEPEVEIPDEVREAYKLYRPTPLIRARRL